MEWDPAAAVTPLGQLPFFIDFLKVSGLFDAFVNDCSLIFQSNNAPDKRAVMAGDAGVIDLGRASSLRAHQRDAP